MHSHDDPARPDLPVDIDQLATAWVEEFLDDLRQDWAGRLHFEDSTANIARQAHD